MQNPALRVAVVNDYEIVVEGLAAMLNRFDDVVLLDRITSGEELTHETIDIVLFDTFGRDGVFGDELATLVAMPSVRHVAVFTLSWTDGLTRVALERGVSGVLSKSLDRNALVAGLRQIAEGEVVVLVAEGLRNLEIARALDLSEDTVKTHLKRAYRKLGVANRAQATNLAVRDPAFRLEQRATADS